jgi:hypothetical protein
MVERQSRGMDDVVQVDIVDEVTSGMNTLLNHSLDLHTELTMPIRMSHLTVREAGNDAGYTNRR